MTSGGELSTQDPDGLVRFEAALRAWATEAEVFLAGSPNAGQLPFLSEDQWQLQGPGLFQRKRVDWVGHDGTRLDETLGLDAYRELEEAAAASPVVARHLNTTVGTPFSQSPLELRGIAFAVLSSPPNLFQRDVPPSADERIERIMRFFRDDSFPCVIYAPLYGITVEGDRLELEPGLVIERMTAREVVAALDYGFITPMAPGMSSFFHLLDQQAFALKRTWSMPKTVGGVLQSGGADAAQISEEQARYFAEADELLQCFALLTSQRIEAASSICIPVEWTPFGSGMQGWRRPTLAFSGMGFDLDEELASELQRLWALSHETSFPQNKALALAFRRLSFAIQRKRTEDRLIDVFIAAEALYLTDGAGEAKDKGELRYRLALRAAVWSDGTLGGWSRREVFRHMKLGYDLRSAVAHGSNPDDKDIKLKGARVSLHDFVVATEEILRAALLKAVNQIEPGRRLTIAWDDLILPEDSKSLSVAPDSLA